MLIALAVLAALEAAPPTVELTRSGAGAGPPVSAAPRTLSDVARELREGRHAVGGFSAVETTVSRGPVVMPVFEWEDEELARAQVVRSRSRPATSWGTCRLTEGGTGADGAARRTGVPHT